MQTKINHRLYCSHCEKLLLPEWVACPYCGEPKNGTRRRQKKPRSEDMHTRFVCPGCGEKATAGDGNQYCTKCKAFVHCKCSVDNWLFPPTCPYCNTRLQ